MARHVSLRGNRFGSFVNPSSWRFRSIRSAESPRSMTENEGSRPSTCAYSRSRRLPIEWNVPDHSMRVAFGWKALDRGDSRSAACAMRSARCSISCAARRVNVSSAMRSGATRCSSRNATRCASVLVLPVPAPAMINNGPPRPRSSRRRRCRARRTWPPAAAPDSGRDRTWWIAC